MGSFLEIAFNSPEYRLACSLRNEVLRLPLGLSLYDEDLELESEHWHFGIFENEALVGCVVVVPLAAGEAQLKQMAIAEAVRGNGLGRRLFEALEARLIAMGVGELRLHARETAVGFYEQLGFESEGELFLEVSIPHVKMRKRIG